VRPRGDEERWLVRSLWLRSAVGVVGGLPKCFKTWFAIELSWAVASGKKALGRFEVEQSGPVLVFLAEDDPPDMRARFDAVATARGTDLETLPISFIDVATLLLDDDAQLAGLRRTIEVHRPRFLVLDPFVRLVRRVDENSAGDVSAVLGELRRIQRDFDVAVLLVHHMRKSRSAHPGQQLRGSGDFAAWCDSAVYLTRKEQARVVTVEHRSAAPPEPFRVQLVTEPHPHLELDLAPASTAAVAEPDNELERAALELIRIQAPCSTVALRNILRVRKAKLVETLSALRSRGLVARTEDGWALGDTPPPT
jgi:AAA domain